MLTQARTREWCVPVSDCGSGGWDWPYGNQLASYVIGPGCLSCGSVWSVLGCFWPVRGPRTDACYICEDAFGPCLAACDLGMAACGLRVAASSCL